MIQHEKNKLKMYKAVEAICMGQQADWNGLPAFAAAFTQFAAKLQELDQAAYNQNIATVGVSAARDQLLETTIEQAYLVGNALRAFASVSNNVLLAEQLDFSKSDFKRGGFQLTLQFIDRVLIHANGYLPALADYGIEQEHVDTLTALRQQLGTTIGSPREAIVDRRHETIEIQKLIDELDVILKEQLDRLVEVLKPDHPAFYHRFRSARVIVDHKGKKNDHGEGNGPGEPDGDPEGTK